MYTSPPQPSKRKLSEADRQRLSVDLAKRISTGELATKYGISRRAVQAYAAKLKRDPHSRNETGVVSMRLHADEVAAIDNLAERLGTTRATVARHVLRRSSGFFDPDFELQRSVADVSRELKRIGTNLNQLVYHANRRALVTGRGEISDRDLGEIVGMRDEVSELSNRMGRLIVSKALSRERTIADIIEGFRPR